MDSRPKYATAAAEELLRPQIKRRWLVGPKFIYFDQLLDVGYALFTMGAILGRAFRSCFDIFAVPYTAQPDSSEAVQRIRSQGVSLALVGQYAKTANELFTMLAMSLDDPTREPDTWPEWLMTHAQVKVPARFGLKMGVMFGVRGAAFGSQFPERFAELYFNPFAKLDSATRQTVYEAGLGVHTTLDEVQQASYISDFADFCAQFYPELVTQLTVVGKRPANDESPAIRVAKMLDTGGISRSEAVQGMESNGVDRRMAEEIVDMAERILRTCPGCSQWGLLGSAPSYSCPTCGWRGQRFVGGPS